jgi:tetratricopeptide (TPR) repeat protein
MHELGRGIKHGRLAPAAVLLAALALAAVCVFARTGNGALPAGRGSGPGDDRDALERAIASGHADVGVWTRYAACLRGLGRHGDAAQAYDLALKLDPANRDLQLQRAVTLAQAGQADLFYQYVYELSLTDPRIAFDILQRAESKPYLSEARFRRVYQDALGQYLD